MLRGLDSSLDLFFERERLAQQKASPSLAKAPFGLAARALASLLLATVPAGAVAGVDSSENSQVAALAAGKGTAGTFKLNIVSPAPGTVVPSGSDITVVVAADPGLHVDEVVVVGWKQVQVDKEAPFQVSLTVPIEAFHSYFIQASGKNNATKEFYFSESIELVAQPTAALRSLRIHPAEVLLLRKGATLPLKVIGLFEDEISRKIPPEEASWTSLSPSVVAVSAEGIVTGLAEGDGTVRCDSLSLQATRTIRVRP